MPCKLSSVFLWPLVYVSAGQLDFFSFFCIIFIGVFLFYYFIILFFLTITFNSLSGRLFIFVLFFSGVSVLFFHLEHIPLLPIFVFVYMYLVGNSLGGLT